MTTIESTTTTIERPCVGVALDEAQLAAASFLARYSGRTLADNNMLHAIQHSMVVDDLGEDPDRWLVVGPDRAANLPEVIVLITAEGDEVIIHAMPLRAVYRKLLDP